MAIGKLPLRPAQAPVADHTKGPVCVPLYDQRGSVSRIVDHAADGRWAPSRINPAISIVPLMRSIATVHRRKRVGRAAKITPNAIVVTLITRNIDTSIVRNSLLGNRYKIDIKILRIVYLSPIYKNSIDVSLLGGEKYLIYARNYNLYEYKY